MNQIRENKESCFLSFYFPSYFCFGIVMSNFTPFLSSLGYDTGERGMLLSAYAFTTIGFQLFFGILADRYRTIKKIVVLSVLGFIAASTLLFTQNSANFMLHFLLIALSGGLLNTLCGLYDTWLLGCEDRIQRRMSFIKAFGSIGWAVGSFVASYIILQLSYQGMAVSLVLVTALILLNLCLLRDINSVGSRTEITAKDVLRLFSNGKYLLLVVILFLMYSVVVANNCTVIDKMIGLGASQTQISLKWSLQSLLEIPTYILGARLLARFDHYRLLRVSAAVLAVQFLGFSLTHNVTMMIMLSVLQLFSTPLILITSKTLIFDLCPAELRGTSQMVALSIFTGASSLMIPALAGRSGMVIGLDMTLMLAVGLSATAFLLICRLQKM